MGYELEPLPRYSGRNSSKTSKTLCCLNSGQPTLQVPSLNRTTVFVMQTVSSVFPYLSSSTVGPHNFQVFLPVLLVKWDQKILFTVCVAMSLAPSLDGKVRGCCTFNFPNRLSGWQMLGAAVILPYILTHLPIHSKGSLQTCH